MNSVIQQAESAHRQGRLEEAERLYLALLDENPQNVDALYGLGTLFMQAQNFDAAEPLLASALALEPKAADIAYNTAICLREKGDLAAASVMAERAALCSGDDEEFSQTICRLLLSLEAPRAVLRQFERYPPGLLASYLLQAQALGQLGAWDRAVALLRRLADENPLNPQLASELALAAARLRDYELAIVSYERYLNLVEPTATEYVKLADLLLLARRVPRCEAALKHAQEAGADTADMHLLLAKLGRLSGDYPRALRASEAAIARDAGNAEAWSILLEMSAEDALPGLIDGITETLARAEFSAYQQQLIDYVLADAHTRLENIEEAFRCYSQANRRQRESMKSVGNQYDPCASVAACERILKQHEARLPAAQAYDSLATPLFILGMPRSGTTLVERMLAQLPSVTAGGENEAMGFLDAHYQREIAAKRLPSPDGMSPDQWSALARRYFGRTPLSGKGGAGAGADRFVTDKMPQNFLHVGLILSLFPHAKIIQMRRDPRDVCWSIFTRMFSEAHSYACDFESLAQTFSISRRLMNHWASLAPDRVIDVSYEALVADPRGQGQRITQFCGLEWNDQCLNFHRTVSTSFTFSELQVREAISERRIGRWQPFERHLAPLFAALEDAGCLD